MLIFQNETNIFLDDSLSIGENNIGVKKISKQCSDDHNVNDDNWVFFCNKNTKQFYKNVCGSVYL